MSDPYIGEIRIFAGNFAPRSWAFCNGQLLSISQNTALFSLLGTTYGGDGRVTFGLPNLQDRAPMHWGDGPGLTPRSIGETAGSNSSTLSIGEMPSHPHNLVASTSPASGRDPTNNPLARSRNGNAYQSVPQSQVPMAAQAVNMNGGGQPHNNMQPYLGVNFIIALQGIFPPRS
jgi:microcystin-dependent protein